MVIRILWLIVAAVTVIAACSQIEQNSKPAINYQLPSEPLRSARLLVSAEAVWAGHPASNSVTMLSLPDGNRIWQTSIGCEPATLTTSKSRLYAACFDSGDIVVLDEKTGKILKRRWVGHGPFGLIAVSNVLYVTLAHDNSLIGLKSGSLEETARAQTAPQPRGIALWQDEIFVVHANDASIRVYDAHTLKQRSEAAIGQNATGAESVTLSPAQMRAYVPHQRMNVTNMTRTFDTIVFPLVSSIDTQSLAPVRREALALDSADRPVSMPMAIALSKDERFLYAVNAASDDLSIVDLNTGIGTGNIEVGENPHDIAISPDGALLYTLNLVSDDITVIDVAKKAVVKTMPLAVDNRPEEIKRGERLFFSSRPDEISRDNWIACASCHMDGGMDGNTWLGSEGGPRNTATLRGIRGTEPLHWSADRADVQSFQQTFQTLMEGKGLPDSDLDALAAYLDSLPPIQSPMRRDDGSLTADAIKGAKIFQNAGCGECHTLPLFTDRQLHDVGTGQAYHKTASGADIPESMGPRFDTPSLRELWLTAPYLHDGRALTLRDVLAQHGNTSASSKQDMTMLEMFLLSLPLSVEEQRSLFK